MARGDKVWIYDSNKSDPVVYAEYADALAAFLDRCGVDTLEELREEMSTSRYTSLEEYDGGAMSVDDGPSLDWTVVR